MNNAISIFNHNKELWELKPRPSPTGSWVSVLLVFLPSSTLFPWGVLTLSRVIVMELTLLWLHMGFGLTCMLRPNIWPPRPFGEKFSPFGYHVDVVVLSLHPSHTITLSLFTRPLSHLFFSLKSSWPSKTCLKYGLNYACSGTTYVYYTQFTPKKILLFCTSVT